MQLNQQKPLKTFTMYAVPYHRTDLRGNLDVEKSGALALFATPAHATEFQSKCVLPVEPIKVRVTIELSGKPRRRTAEAIWAARAGNRKARPA